LEYETYETYETTYETDAYDDIYVGDSKAKEKSSHTEKDITKEGDARKVNFLSPDRTIRQFSARTLAEKLQI